MATLYAVSSVPHCVKRLHCKLITGGGLVRLDLTDPSAVAAFIRETKPALLVHSAAQRFPDKVEGDTEAARRLNVASTEAIAKAMGELHLQ